MNENNAVNNETEVLNCIYRGAETGCDAIEDITSKVDDVQFLSDIKTQENEYRDIGNQAQQKLMQLGTIPEPASAAQKMGMKMGVEMNTAFNSDTSRLAELMIKGSNMGVVRMTKVLNQYKGVSTETTDLAQRLIRVEEQNIQRLKAYL